MSKNIYLGPLNKDPKQKIQLQQYYECFKNVWNDYLGAVTGEAFDESTALLSVQMLQDTFESEMMESGLGHTDLVFGVELPDDLNPSHPYFVVTGHWTHKTTRFYVVIDKFGFAMMSKNGRDVEEITEPPLLTHFHF